MWSSDSDDRWFTEHAMFSRVDEILKAYNHMTVENVEVLLGNEDIVKRALDQIPLLLGVLRSFGGDEVIEYPLHSTLSEEVTPPRRPSSISACFNHRLKH